MENIGSELVQNRPEYPGCRITERPLYITFRCEKRTIVVFDKVNVTSK